MNFLAGAGPGLWPLRSPKLGLVLAVKASADLAFGAKHRRALKFHYYPLEVAGKRSVGIITAVYDREDAPVTIQTVCVDDIMRGIAIEIATMDTMGIYFFDSHNSELFGGKWKLSKTQNTAQLFDSYADDLDEKNTLEFYVRLRQTFSNPNNDGIVIDAALIEENRPHDVLVLHVTEDHVLSSRGEGLGIYKSSLTNDDGPGSEHEAQIARLLTKIYALEKIVVNPEFKPGKEFCDVLAIGKIEAIAIHAKSTIRDQNRFNEETTKRDSRLDKHFKKALAQAKGAERAFYQLKKEITFDRKPLGLTQDTKLLIHLIILYDKPPSLFEKWSEALGGFASDTTPVVVLDMPEFVNMLAFNKDRDSLNTALLTLAEHFQNEKRIGQYAFHKGRLAIH